MEQNNLEEKRYLSPADREIVDAVIRAACMHYEVTIEELISVAKLARVRHLCFYIISQNSHLNEKTIGVLFNKGRTAVQYGISQIETHRKIYRQVLGSHKAVVELANNFEKKHEWHIQ